MTGALPRLAAAGVAVIAWAGLSIQFAATFGQNGSAAQTLWILLRFFTVTTNLLVAILFTALAVGRAVSPRMITGVMLAIMLVGIVYMLLLRGLLELSGGALLADMLLHKVTPVLVPLWWLAFASKGASQRTDPLLWAIFPALYLPYALARGLSGDGYAYPFINVAKLGWTQVAINCTAIAAGFILAGYAVLWVDRAMARTSVR
ncbi:Pr6Pr family membrane protein [Sphingobium phenoxybenzoativorans]|uniref:Pr6Pr family membrane protein n=1 Tax=Sphingobium phenoxybenzoativorans TaxID=1592790 RepID=UPI001FE3FE6B|nr:Pr6Pr family membrane protein [Sphingobium phenoxybenzoativorans]